MTSIEYKYVVIPCPSIGALENLLAYIFSKVRRDQIRSHCSVLIPSIQILLHLQQEPVLQHLLALLGVPLYVYIDSGIYPIDKTYLTGRNLRAFSIASSVRSLTITAENLVADHHIFLRSYKKLLLLIKPRQLLSVDHGINLAPLILPSLSSVPSLSAPLPLTHYYHSLSQYQFFTKHRHISGSTYQHSPIFRHNPDWLHFKQATPYSRPFDFPYIAVFSRPCSSIFLLSDLDFYKQLFIDLLALQPDIHIVLRPHPKETNRYVEKFFSSIVPASRFHTHRHDSLSLALFASHNITIYSNLSIDFARFSLPHSELYCVSLSRFSGCDNYFVDSHGLPSLDYRYYGFSPPLLHTDCISPELLPASRSLPSNPTQIYASHFFI